MTFLLNITSLLPTTSVNRQEQSIQNALQQNKSQESNGSHHIGQSDSLRPSIDVKPRAVTGQGR